jgi:SNF2 family DNA or RNA helicase
LLEPALDPAIEQQAVARVHRIGQNRYHCRDRACT